MIRRSSKRIKRSAELRTKKPMKRKSRPKAETERVYGPTERRAWIKAQRCLVDSVACSVGSENAHTTTGGMGRKSDAKTVIPLCNHHHWMLHVVGTATFQHRYCINLKEAAAETETRWQTFLAHGGEPFEQDNPEEGDV